MMRKTKKYTFITSVMTLMLALFMIMPIGSANASSISDIEVSKITLDKSSEADFDAGLKMFLVKAPESGVIYFDTNKAREAGVSTDLLAVGEDFNQVSLAYADKKSRIGIPVWGNYCGPGHSGPGKPIDRLDTACMNHDNCYARRGYFSVECDRQLIAEIDANIGRMGRGEKAMAYAIRTYFKAQAWWNS